ncbi:MAG: hypothetical protein H7270_08490 [Dermatophilaceae bacterium]|nr:hypothetical protein [Dermatophilaceae bacterium]
MLIPRLRTCERPKGPVAEVLTLRKKIAAERDKGPQGAVTTQYGVA